MSTLRVDNLQNRSGGSVLPSVQLCKAWVNFNGTGVVAIRSAFNVTSITDVGVGDYTVNFTTTMTDANYSVIGITSGDGVASSVLCENTLSTTRSTTTTVAQVRVISTNSATGAAVDRCSNSVAIFAL